MIPVIPHPGDLVGVLAVILVLWLPVLVMALWPARRRVLRRLAESDDGACRGAAAWLGDATRLYLALLAVISLLALLGGYWLNQHWS